MATAISIATGNFTTAGTWAVVDATSFLDSEANSTASTTSNVFSATFTPGAITVDGVAVKVASRTASPAGTVTVGLFLSAGSTLVSETTINATDIANTNSGVAYNRGWYFFKFASSTLLTAATLYKIGFRSSSAGTVTIYRNATVGNWSRMLRTTTTGAPASGDQLHVIGEHTGAGTGNSFTVTMDNTATTSFGPTVSGGPANGFTIGKRGTLTFGTSASTNYYLKWKGIMLVADGGTLNVGTSGTPMPGTSTAVLEMDSVANIDTNINVENGGTISFYGASKTNFKTLLTTSIGGFCSTVGTAVTALSGSQTFTGLTGTININGSNFTISSVTNSTNLVLTGTAGTLTNVPWFHSATANVAKVSDTTGWANSDVLVFAPTTTVFTEAEKGTITSVDSSTQVTLTASLTHSHYGASPMPGEVGNLTRNVKIRGVSSILQGFIDLKATSTATMYYAELYQLGGTGPSGIVVATTTGSFDMQYCARYDSTVTTSVGVRITSASGNNITLSNNIFYNIQAEWLTNVATSGVYTVNNNLFMLGNGTGMTLADTGITFTNNTLAGSSAGMLSATTDTGVLGTWSGNTFHSFTGSVSALDFQAQITGAGSTLSNTTVWGCSANAQGQIRWRTFMNDFTIDGLTTFYCGGVHMSFNNGAYNFFINNWTANSAISSADTAGLLTGSTAGSVNQFIISNSDFSTVRDIRTVLANDISTQALLPLTQIYASNTKFGGTVVWFRQSTDIVGSFLASQKHNQTVATHKTFFPYGDVSYDAVIFDSSPSMRLAPNNATNRLQSAPFTAAVLSGATCTPTVKVRESVAGDGTDYNGQRARLFVRNNVAAGIASDTLLATATIASEGAWESLSAATAAVTDDCVLEFYVDCGGAGFSTGWCNVDTGSVAVSNSTAGFKYWKNGAPVADLASAQIGVGGGASSTYA